MYELYPYFTNDGTVGLFSKSDDDIYHSTYGALSESWQKFIIPSHLEEYLSNNKEVKILDICYGIGYNTKTSLQAFLNEVTKNEKQNKKNKKSFQNFQKKIKNCAQLAPNIAAIDTDNIRGGKEGTLESEKCEISKNKDNSQPNSSKLYSLNIAEIGSDNICKKNSAENYEKSFKFVENEADFGFNESYNDESVAVKSDATGNNEHQAAPQRGAEINSAPSILIDAVDMDKVLIGISPFMAERHKKNNFWVKNDLSIIEHHFQNDLKYEQIKNMKRNKIKFKKEFELTKECSIILFDKLAKSDSAFLEDENVQSVLSQKKYSPFLSRFMLNFAKFYSNQGYNYNKSKNKSTFLHNIYYRYLSTSYKNARKLLKTSKIDLNFHHNDARKFISSIDNKYNFIFLDAFTPAKCPSLWTIQFFKELYSRLEDDGIILTYSNSAAVRNAFLQNGFYIGKIYDKELSKFTGTVATKNVNLIEHQLDEYDFGLIHSKAGICFEDENLTLDNDIIIKNREAVTKNSELISSSKFVKGYKKNGKSKASL